jgi:two-component sensor histidine kinase
VIRVSLKTAEYGRFTLTVEDDGVGLPEKFDLQQNTSLGLRLICILTEQIHGSIQIRRQPGAAFIITAQEIKIKERIKA